MDRVTKLVAIRSNRANHHRACPHLLGHGISEHASSVAQGAQHEHGVGLAAVDEALLEGVRPGALLRRTEASAAVHSVRAGRFVRWFVGSLVRWLVRWFVRSFVFS